MGEQPTVEEQELQRDVGQLGGMTQLEHTERILKHP